MLGDVYVISVYGASWNTVCNVRCVVNVVLLLRSWTSEVSLEQCDDADIKWLFVTTRLG